MKRLGTGLQKLGLGIFLLISCYWPAFAGSSAKLDDYKVMGNVRNLVLVPGFFNSLVIAPSRYLNSESDFDLVPSSRPLDDAVYFSRDILKALRSAGFRVWVANSLNPVGGLEENGRRLMRYLDRLQAEVPEFGSQPFVLLGHSAGGLYGLYALAQGDYPVERMIAVDTPFKGLKFLETLARRKIPIESLAVPFHLTNLSGLRDSKVQNFLSDLEFKKPLRLDTFSGHQKTRIDLWNFESLSTLMNIFQAFTREDSDGIVTLESANFTRNLSVRNAQLSIINHSSPLKLDHWELVADYRYSIIGGVLNFEALRKAQGRAFLYVLKESGI